MRKLTTSEPCGELVLSAEIKDLLSQLSAKNSAKTVGGLSYQDFATELFSRAPATLLRECESRVLVELSQTAYSFLEAHLQSGDEFSLSLLPQVESSKGQQVSALLTAMVDRPFIVDTLGEALRTNQLRPQLLLHPIIRLADGRLISLTYCEMEMVQEANKLTQLEEELQHRFAALVQITNGFSPVVSKLETVIAEFKKLSEEELKEEADFLSFLLEGGFFFVGSLNWKIDEKQKLSADKQSAQGLFALEHNLFSPSMSEIENHLRYHLEKGLRSYVGKTPALSPVHRFWRMDLVSIHLPKSNSMLCLLGLFTSKALAQEPSSVPIVRKKLNTILVNSKLPTNSHDYKEIISVVKSLSTTELFQYPVEVLEKDIDLIMSAQWSTDIKVRFFQDPIKQLTSVLVAFSRSRYAAGYRKKIVALLEQRFGTSKASSEFHITTTDYPLYVLHILLPSGGKQIPNVKQEEVEELIRSVILTWDDLAKEYFIKSSPAKTLTDLSDFYIGSLPNSYKAINRAEKAVEDAAVLESLDSANPLEARIQHSERDAKLLELSLYKLGEPYTISNLVPPLENIGFHVVEENVFALKQVDGSTSSIARLLLRPRCPINSELERVRPSLLEGLVKILKGECDSDRLNELLLNPGLTQREVSILRILSHYLWQIKVSTSGKSVVTALTENPKLALILVKYFSSKFDPQQFSEQLPLRLVSLNQIKAEFFSALKDVSQLAHDRTLRSLFNVIEACVRTNFFRVRDEARVAIKIDCKLVERMPSPRPYYEIFVNAPEFEGCHLRGGPVARGGLRWSDRLDDYRTEVLGLVKTQMVKNSVIVPVGAKGGFVLKNRPADPAELPAAVRACYARFIRSMLEITDNRLDGKLVHPQDCVVYDGEDPYFVVAADKGTATFSDLANSIAQNEFNFWLGDAFASGGSQGYDHKKLAITSRGAWETSCRHFRELGIDHEQQEFSVVGIGDMSGDVFGNGLLRSKNARLLAAFDHRHIFIDPKPNAAVSFEERLRLFNLPGSKWSDYNPRLISEGGGVFPREQKEIQISSEVRQALGIEATVLSGQELVRCILKAPVDLLWNGGIGTYVKAKDEDNFSVGDSTNDELRVDACELRAKVIAEGGNLGLTQRARIEFAKAGGKINTDAVDNSGGVNTSDLEVNIKILLAAALRRGAITLEERNSLLAEYSTEVCEKVVRRNSTQSLAISLGVRRSRRDIGFVKPVISTLEKEGLLDRRAEYLPDDAALDARFKIREGLYRPELALLVGYSKMSAFNDLMKADYIDEPFMEKYLVNYFPKGSRERFKADILQHPLRREIIATEVANEFIERMGSSCMFRLAQQGSIPKALVIKAYLVASEILRTEQLASALDVLDRASSSRPYLQFMLGLSNSLEKAMQWLILHSCQDSIANMVKRYEGPYRELEKQGQSLAAQLDKTKFNELSTELALVGIPREMGSAISSLGFAAVQLDVVEVSQKTDSSVLDVAKLTAAVYQKLHLQELLEKAESSEAKDRLAELALQSLKAELPLAAAKLVWKVIEKSKSPQLENLNKLIESKSELFQRYEQLFEEISARQVDVASLLILLNLVWGMGR